MTEKLYYNNPDLLEFEADIVETGEANGKCYTILDKSAFYPTSGGQPHDTGFLNDVRIDDVTENDEGNVFHYSEKPIGSVGESIKGLIDGKRRQHFCQQHTAQHIISQVFIHLYDLPTESVHLGEEYTAVELNIDTLSLEQLTAVEKMSSEIIEQNLPVNIIFIDKNEAAKLPLRKLPDREGKIRLIKIGEFDYSACGGTHCKSTSSVRLLKIIGTEKIRGHTLVKFLAGNIAVDDYIRKFQITGELTQKLTCHQDDLVNKIVKLEDDNKAYRKEIVGLQREMLPIHADKLADDFKNIGRFKAVICDLGNYESKLAGQLAGLVAKKIEGLVLFQIGQRLILSVSENCDVHAGDIAKRFTKLTGLKGGGSNLIAQIGGAEEGQLEKYGQYLSSILDEL